MWTTRIPVFTAVVEWIFYLLLFLFICQINLIKNKEIKKNDFSYFRQIHATLLNELSKSL
jgi:hypothetical protein